MIPTKDAYAYAKLLLEAGLDFQAGQCLSISAEPIHWPLLNIIAEQAYQKGALYVHIDAAHAELLAARVRHSSKENLSFLPDYLTSFAQESADIKWARLRIAGQESPELFSTLSGEKLGIIQKAQRNVAKPVSLAAQADKLPWCVAAAPTPKWGAQVFQDEANDASEAALWQAMRKILRLDQPDPVATWKQLATQLQQRCELLNQHGFDSISLRSKSTGTDLQIGLHQGGHWLGGGATLPDGRHFLPNLPTEECFTTPDYRRAEGVLQVTRPVDVLGKEVVGARFTFEQGKVVDFDAEKGLDALTQLLEMDPQAVYAGELALVDNASPIYQSGLTFHNILFDENATCHLALGSAYPKAVPGAENWTEAEKLRRGVNESLVHTDFMFGADDLVVSGLDQTGASTTILDSGSFVL